jgi:PAS domain S-box-containing protein
MSTEDERPAEPASIEMADEERRPIGERLKIAEESLNSLLSHSLDGIMFVNPSTDTILDANGRACSMLGQEKQALLGSKATDIFLPDYREKYSKLLGQTLLKNGDHFQMKASVGKPRTHALPVEALAIMVDTNGSRRLHLILRDVSMEHHIQGQLRSQVSLLQNVNDAIISIDLNETVLFMNKKAESVYGLKAEEAICRHLYDVVRYKFLSPAQEEEAHTQVEQNGFWRGEVIHHNKDGRPISVDTSVSMIYDDERRPNCVVIVSRDITARKESERKLKRRGDEMAALYEIGQALSRHLSLNDVLSVIRTQVSRLMNARNFYIALYDETKDEVFFPVYVDELVRKDGTSRKAAKGYTEYVIHKGSPLLLSKEAEEQMVRDGYQGIGPQAASWLGVPLSSGQKVIGMMAVQSYSNNDQYGEDDVRILSAIADQVAVAIENARMFERVRISEETYRNLVESMSEGYMLIQNGKITLVNRSLAECLSYSKEELVGRDVGTILMPESREAILALQSSSPEQGEDWSAAKLGLISRQGHRTELDFSFRSLSYEGAPAVVGICSRFVTAPAGKN